MIVTNENNFGPKAYINRLSKTGTLIWQKVIGGHNNYDNYNTAIISGNTITLAGYRTNNYYVDTALTIAAFQDNGTFLWEKTIATPRPAAAAVSSARLKNGNYIVLSTRHFGRGNYNFSNLTRLTSAGIACNTTNVNVSETDNNIDTFASTSYYSYHYNLLTPILSFVAAPNLTETNLCGAAQDAITDVEQKTVASIAGVSSAFATEVYPNPVINKLSVKITMRTTGAVKAELIDMYGKTVVQQAYTLSAGMSVKEINTGSLARGAYLLKVSTDTEVKTNKIIKE